MLVSLAIDEENWSIPSKDVIRRRKIGGREWEWGLAGGWGPSRQKDRSARALQDGSPLGAPSRVRGMLLLGGRPLDTAL